MKTIEEVIKEREYLERILEENTIKDPKVIKKIEKKIKTSKQIEDKYTNNND